MNVFRRAVAVFSGGLLLASIVSAIAARAAKERIVRLDDPEADEVRDVAIFEPISLRSIASAFRGGTVDCWFGGGVIDLRDATLDPAGARLQVRAIFGGAQILVPQGWRVSSRVVGIGGLGDGRPRVELASDAPLLAIEGVAVLGGFAVMSEISEAEARGFREAVARFTEGKHSVPTASVVVAPAV